MKKKIKVIKFLRNELFLVLIVSLLLSLSCVGYTQDTSANEEIKVIRQTEGALNYIDPAVGRDYASSIALCNLYDALVFPNPDGSVKPLLAKGWEISGDGLTYTFELVPGVKFHNGDELTADDVVFSLERFINIGEGLSHLFTTSVEGVEALEKYKVQFTLKEPLGPFLQVLIRLCILNEKQIMANTKEGPYGEFGDYGREWLATHDAGSGPYKVKELKTEEYLLMEKFNDYWAGWENKDAPQYVKKIGTNEAITVRTLMSRGELEITDHWQAHDNLVAIDQIPNTEVSSLFEGVVLKIMLNTKIPPTDDIHFRKALAYLFDYDTCIDMIFPGCRRSGPIAPSTPGYNPNLEIYTMDLAKAEEELKQSPYYDKLDQYTFNLHWVSNVPDEEKIALLLQANAAKLGINVNIVKTVWLSLLDLMVNTETTPNGVILFFSLPYAEAGSSFMLSYHSSSCGTYTQGEWLQDPVIDAMIEDALTTVDQEERFQKYYDIQEVIVELCPTIWIMEQAVKQVHRSDYVVFPAAEALKQGELCNSAVGYNFYYRDFKVTPEKAQPPYIPFKP